MATTYDPTAKHKGGEHMEKVKDAGSDAMQKTKDAGRDLLGKAKETGEDALKKTKEAGSEVMGKARDAVSAVGDMATQTATNVGQKAESLTSSAGHQLRELGDTIAGSLPREGIAGSASQAVADGIRSSGRYLEEAKLSGMAQDMEQVVKNHPIPAMMVCLGIGFCLGRMFKD